MTVQVTRPATPRRIVVYSGIVRITSDGEPHAGTGAAFRLVFTHRDSPPIHEPVGGPHGGIELVLDDCGGTW